MRSSYHSLMALIGPAVLPIELQNKAHRGATMWLFFGELKWSDSESAASQNITTFPGTWHANQVHYKLQASNLNGQIFMKALAA